MQHLIKKDAQCSNINSVVLDLSFNHFRAHVVQCPAVSVSLLLNCKIFLPLVVSSSQATPSEIADFNIHRIVEEKIFRFKITMEHPLAMDVLYCSTNLYKKLMNFLLVVFFFFHEVPHRPARSVFHDQVDFPILDEVLKQFDHIRMT
jgi:hypothetical protein